MTEEYERRVHEAMTYFTPKPLDQLTAEEVCHYDRVARRAVGASDKLKALEAEIEHVRKLIAEKHPDGQELADFDKALKSIGRW